MGEPTGLYAYPADLYPTCGFPDANLAKIKRLAAKAGRTLYEREKHQAARDKLREAMKDLSMGELNIWATAIMIDHRWCGATGQGAYWAVASELCNEAALDELRTRPSFVVE